MTPGAQRGLTIAALGALSLALACDESRAKPPARSVAEQARARAAFDRYRQPERVIAGLGLRGGERVLDVGAGDGYLTLPLAAAIGPRGRALAIDVDAAALESLRERAAGMGLAATIETRRVAPADPGLADDERFDRILLGEVDHLLPDRAAYLARLRRHLAPGGRIAVTNRQHFRKPLLDAATSLGLVVTSEIDGLPGHFLILFGETS